MKKQQPAGQGVTHKNMTIVNLTEHPVTIMNRETMEVIARFPKGETVARLTQKTVNVGVLRFNDNGVVNEIPITETQFGETTGLPEPQDGVSFIVSRMIMSAHPERKDLLVPNGIIRNSEGVIIASESFAVN